MDEKILDLYKTNEYLVKNPSLHTEDSSWKVSKLIPLIDEIDIFSGKKELCILDVGGGAGTILEMISKHIIENNYISIRKYALDLSPGALRVQKETNPDLVRTLNEDIRNTTLGYKEIDLTLMIDVLEHIPEPERALEEVCRISKYAIFKVPLENNLAINLSDFLSEGQTKSERVTIVGHINHYNNKILMNQIKDHCGEVIAHSFTNVLQYVEKQSSNRSNKMKLLNFLSRFLYQLSPNLNSRIFTDYALLAVECYDEK